MFSESRYSSELSLLNNICRLTRTSVNKAVICLPSRKMLLPSYKFPKNSTFGPAARDQKSVIPKSFIPFRLSNAVFNHSYIF